MELIHFNSARQQLMLARDIDEVMQIRDKAEALRAYLRQQGEGLEMQNAAAEIKLRAERRAGELLGEEQSGHMQKIGFSLYTEMLEEAVEAIKAGRTPNSNLEMEKAIDINLRIPALIPEDYLPDVHLRLIMYKRISASKDTTELEDLQAEMIDRFGLLPEALKLLFRLTQLKLRAVSFGIKKIDANISQGRIEFSPHTCVDPLSIVRLIQNDPVHYKLNGANQLQFAHSCSNADEKLALIGDLLGKLRIAEPEAA